MSPPPPEGEKEVESIPGADVPIEVTKDFDILGQVSSKELLHWVENGKYRSVINLCGPEEECSLPCSFPAKCKVPCVRAQVDHQKLSFGLAMRLLATLESAPLPALIQCHSNYRASAVAMLYIATHPPADSDISGPGSLKGWMSMDDAMKWAKEHKLPFLEPDKEHLVQWVKNFLAARSVDLKREGDLFFRQLFDRESCTYSYVLADPTTREAIIIDPVLEMLDRDLELLNEHGLILKYALNTHVHADHVTSTGKMKTRLDGFKSVLSGTYKTAISDVKVQHGDSLYFGDRFVECRATPGHTDGCLTYVLDDHSMAFTGDALLIRGCGRTDFQSGDAALLYKSVWEQIFSLPQCCKLYPGHDYKGRQVSSVWEEIRFNTRLTKTKDEFIHLMNTLGLPKPAKIDIAVPANLKCGIQDE